LHSMVPSKPQSSTIGKGISREAAIWPYSGFTHAAGDGKSLLCWFRQAQSSISRSEGEFSMPAGNEAG
jgi:hypothetical protein